ncbi:MAG: sigma-70 family RNA polymerase sigma factor [Bacteroidota bacterium]
MFLSKQRNIGQTDEEILQQYRKSGKQLLLGHLFNDYIHLVYGLCLKYLKNAEKSQDAVMDIYEHISKKLLETEVQHFKSWLYMVSKNHCLMALRTSKPEMTTEIFMESVQQVHLKEEKIELEQDLVALEQCIDKLKEEQKGCVQKFFLQKKSYQLITEETGIAMKKVKSHIQNGKRNLKICLEQKNVER